MSPHSNECSLIRADCVLVYDYCVAGRLLGSSNEHGLAVMRKGKVINIGLTLVVF